MKTTIGLIILASLCIGLGIALYTTKQHATEEKVKDTQVIGDFSNKVVVTETSLDELHKVNGDLTNDLTLRRQEIVTLTTVSNQISQQLTETSASLAKTEASLKASQEETAKRDARIAELESRNHDLDQKALELGNSITNLNLQIADTQRKLTTSEGNRAFLEKELKRLMAEKAELERQFNDIAVLREQVKKLREELNVATRLEWIRKGLFARDEQKGAQRLIQSGPSAPAKVGEAQPEKYDLNVEVSPDGSLKVIPPATNSPAGATTPAPPK